MKENEEKYEKRELDAAKDLTKLQRELMWPNDNVLKRLLKEGGVINTELNEGDVDIRNAVYGTPVPIIKGCMICKHPITHRVDKTVILKELVPK